MEITEVRIKLMENADDRLQAFCSVTFDHAFVVRDLKIIGGANGPFVAMPSRKLTSHCPQCGFKNHLRAHYCNQCGARQRDDRTVRDPDGRIKLYADIAHPINAQCREQIQSRVLAEFRQELDRSRLPGYVSRYDEDYDLDYDLPTDSSTAPSAGAPAAAVDSQPARGASSPGVAETSPGTGGAETAMKDVRAAAEETAKTTAAPTTAAPTTAAPTTAAPTTAAAATVEPTAAPTTAAPTAAAAATAATTTAATKTGLPPADISQSAPPIPPPHTPPRSPRGNRAFGAGVFDEQRGGRGSG
jgi:stage V sporulation protein G